MIIRRNTPKEDYSFLTRDTKLIVLTRLIRSKETKTEDKLKALDMMNKIDGTYKNAKKIKTAKQDISCIWTKG